MGRSAAGPHRSDGSASQRAVDVVVVVQDVRLLAMPMVALPPSARPTCGVRASRASVRRIAPRHSRVIMLFGVACETPAHRELLPVCCPRTPNQAPKASSRVRRPGLTCAYVWWARQGLNL
jgi:hypothetical protein